MDDLPAARRILLNLLYPEDVAFGSRDFLNNFSDSFLKQDQLAFLKLMKVGERRELGE